MVTGQVGIFSLGDAAHGFFEFTLREGADPEQLVRAVADLRPPHTTVGGVNLVVGFCPELWRRVVPGGAPAEVHGFNEPLRGADGYVMPATQADLFVWYAASAYDIVFDLGSGTLAALAPLATLSREMTGWSYRHSRDLTGFEDGTENPSLYEAPGIALIEDGAPGAGGSVLLFQRWRHDGAAFLALSEPTQEAVIGRTKADSVELEGAAMPRDSHVSRTKVLEDGSELHIFRRNVPYGMVSEHGTLFVGFSADQGRMHRMLEQMAGIDGPRDALTRYTTPLTGAYYFVPSVQALASFTTPDDD
ncbi:MAG: Dyp-type peroxidase [Vulcanimicrobiaceae bacterium]|jgi:putative iron-dependent peroxidase